jgi:hypothetical protein
MSISSSWTFNASAKFWLGIQDDFDLEEEKKLKKAYNAIMALKMGAAWYRLGPRQGGIPKCSAIKEPKLMPELITT